MTMLFMDWTRRKFLTLLGALGGTFIFPPRSRAIAWDFSFVDAKDFDPTVLQVMHAASRPSEWLCPAAHAGDKCRAETPTITTKQAQATLDHSTWVAVLSRNALPIMLIPMARLTAPDDEVQPLNAFFRKDLYSDPEVGREIGAWFMSRLFEALSSRRIRRFAYVHPGREPKTTCNTGNRDLVYRGATVEAAGRAPSDDGTGAVRSWRVSFDVGAAVASYRTDDEIKPPTV
jgi:hypothetical protein